MELVISDGKSINANKLVTGRTCVIGQSGSGKSYTVAVICEELAKNNIGFCIIDLEGEYFGLKEKYPILWVGSGANCDVDIESVDFESLAQKIIKKGFPTIFDVSDVKNPRETVKKFIGELYKVESKSRKPFLLIIEEIDKFAPQRGEVLPEIEEVSRRGRKRGLGLMVATQRPALVNKNVLSQCGNQIIGKLTINNDLDAVKIFFPNKDDLAKLPRFEAGQFFIQGDIDVGEIVRIRKRETPHKAITPEIVQTKAIKSEDLLAIESELGRVEAKEIEEETEEVRKTGLHPNIDAKEAFEKIKNSTKILKFLGKGKTISGMHLVLHPIFECKIKYLNKKLIGSSFEDITTYFDGITGNVVLLKNKLAIRFRVENLIGLESKDVDLLRMLLKSDGLSVTEMSNKGDFSESTVRDSIKNLEKNKLVMQKRKGRSFVYLPLTDVKIPNIKQLSQKQIDFESMKAKAKVEEEKITLADLKNLIRGLGVNAEIVEHKIVYYPFYKAFATTGKRTEKIVMDGISGRII